MLWRGFVEFKLGLTTFWTFVTRGLVSESYVNKKKGCTLSVTHEDSVAKIVKYFMVVTKVPFKVKGQTIQPRPLRISALIARGYTCPEGCGACCWNFSLDYLPSEFERSKPPGVKERLFEFNGRKKSVYTDYQTQNAGKYCKHVSSVNGLCNIYPVRPFSCDFELIRCKVQPKMPCNDISVARYSRGPSFIRPVDQKKGALCEILEPSDDSIKDTIRKFRRLEEWASYFGLTETWIPEIINFLQNTKGTMGDITLIP